jgi:hypothetical protein
VVTPDGVLRRVDADHEPELFFALRGGPTRSSAASRSCRAPASHACTATRKTIPAVGDGILLEKLDDRAIDSFLRLAGPGSPLVAAELRQLGGALAAAPAGAGARGHLEGRFLLFGVGVPGDPAPAAALDAHLDRLLAAMQPWATSTRFASFAERWSSLRTAVPDDVLDRFARTRAVVDSDGLLIAPHPPSGR